jgi:preprotein translocase subunit YajC
VDHFLISLLQQQPGGSFLTSFAPMILIFGVFYFLIIRPQSRKAKLHQQMLNELKAGDDVVTTGGIIGRITGIKDDEIVLQVQESVRIRLLRSAITGRYGAAVKPAGAKADVKAS